MALLERRGGDGEGARGLAWEGGLGRGVLFEVSQGEMGETGMSQRKGSRGGREVEGRCSRVHVYDVASQPGMCCFQTWISQLCAPEASDPLDVSDRRTDCKRPEVALLYLVCLRGSSRASLFLFSFSFKFLL